MEDSDSRSFLENERAQRLAKIEALRERGIDPYPARFEADDEIAEIRARFAELEPGSQTEDGVRIAGRLMLIRRHGALDFADVRDATGNIQLFASLDDLGAELHEEFRGLDLGDWIGVEGTVMTTKRGELSVKVGAFQLLAKALRPISKEAHAVADVDTRYRERHVDLLLNADARRIFEIRSATIASVRRTLAERGFREVETPVLDTTAGGALARPFVTHHNALDLDLYLRIALELPLKRLLVGGMGRVFEIGRVFRNEGLDTRHNPEFTLLEAYQALADYTDVMELVEATIAAAATDATGTTALTVDGQAVEVAPPYRRVTMAELIQEATGSEMHPSMALDDARRIADDHGVEYLETWGSGRLMAQVYEQVCEPRIVEPTFVLDHPLDISPLARAHRDDPELAERFELVIAGRELANAYSELNDPEEQRRRFGADHPDEDYVRALEYGLPPAGGLGIGLDRLVMLLADVSSIREVILFPTMRPAG